MSEEHTWPDWCKPTIDPAGTYGVYPNEGKPCTWCGAIHFGSVICPYSPAAHKLTPTTAEEPETDHHIHEWEGEGGAVPREAKQ